MKICIELIRHRLSECTHLAIVQNLERNFKIISDSKDIYSTLQFITIDGEDLQVDLNGINVELRSISKPHKSVGIYKEFIYAVEVVV